MMTRLYSYVCALHVCVYSSTYCTDSGYTCDCYFLCSSEHFFFFFFFFFLVFFFYIIYAVIDEDEDDN